jgi:F0F1-type ATP synthase membrane subunit b/b'
MNKNLKTYLKFLEDYNNSILYFVEKADNFKSDFQKLKKDYTDKLLKYENNKNFSLQNLKTNFEKEINALDEKKKRLIGEINRYKLIFEEVTQSNSLPKSSAKEKVEELKV